MALTREAVVWGFRLILGREPESEEGIQAHLKLPDETTLISVLLRSSEFRASGRLSDTVTLRAEGAQERAAPWPYQSRSALKLVVFGNCQAASIGKLAQAMTGDIVARTFETTPSFIRRMRDGEFDLPAALAGADLIWVQMVSEVTQSITKQVPRLASRIRQIPPLNYAGFHPDCVYVARSEGGYLQGPMGEYQSSLAFWAWRQGLSPDAAVDLFRGEVFEQLGFHEYHLASQRVLQSHGQRTGLPMVEFIDRWREQGCFMHTVNHPKLPAQADLVAQALHNEGIAPLREATQWVDDDLARWPVWPVYPEIAERSGMAGGGYTFKIDRGFCPVSKPVLTMDLARFVEESFDVFGRAGGTLRCDRESSPPYQDLHRFVRQRPRLTRPSTLTRIAGVIGAALAPALRTGASSPHSASPYEGLPDRQFWRRAVERLPADEIDPVSHCSFTIDRAAKVATAGSCFAQHIARTLARENFNFLVVDHPQNVTGEEARRRNFGVYSARYGNLYTARQLVQLFDRAYGNFQPKDRAWQRVDGRWVDPFRPQVEPDGFDSAKAVEVAMQSHLGDVRRMFGELDVFVFTLGLTEGWRHREDGAVYPLAPGVAGGRFEAETHEFVNFDVADVMADLRGFVRRLRTVNERARLILTVSPVPLIATYEDRHVLVSTIHSKSILRAAAGTLAGHEAGIDYFPSYEIITGAPSRGQYFESDLRSVSEAGVAHVMRLFMRHYARINSTDDPRAEASLERTVAIESIEREQRALDDIVCDEEAIDRHRS
ncbi:MAG: GSCFA domain-containing protein [Burkholderiaceae bacterium]